MSDNKLYDTDYVLYDKANDSVVRWKKDGDIVIFGDKDDAMCDCYGNESVVRCTELPIKFQDELIKQINK